MKKVRSVSMRIVAPAVIILAASLLAGCQGNQFVSGVDVRTITIDERPNLEVNTHFASVGFYLPNVAVPIKDPRSETGEISGPL